MTGMAEDNSSQTTRNGGRHVRSWHDILRSMINMEGALWKIASAGFAFALALMGWNARKMDQKVEDTASTVGEHDSRLATLEESKRSQEGRMAAVERSLIRIDDKLDRLLARE